MDPDWSLTGDGFKPNDKLTHKYKYLHWGSESWTDPRVFLGHESILDGLVLWEISVESWKDRWNLSKMLSYHPIWVLLGGASTQQISPAWPVKVKYKFAPRIGPDSDSTKFWITGWTREIPTGDLLRTKHDKIQILRNFYFRRFGP